MSFEWLMSLDFWKHVSIPFVAGLVGWATNWVAIKLTFQPIEFVGLRPFLGWQGIIPSKAGKMAAIFAESTMFRLGTLGEIFRQMDPDKMWVFTCDLENISVGASLRKNLRLHLPYILKITITTPIAHGLSRLQREKLWK